MKRQDEDRQDDNNPNKRNKSKSYNSDEQEYIEPKQLTFYQPPSTLSMYNANLGADTRHEEKCFACQNSFKTSDRALFYQGKLFHDVCFVCDSCKCPLQGVNHFIYGTKLYCESDYSMVVKSNILSSFDSRLIHSPTKSPTSSEPNTLSLLSQPAPYQIANYNLHPTPVVNFDVTIPANNTVTAILVDATNHTELPSGFQTGQVRPVEAGTKVVYFTGLKLSKMGKIKNDLEYAKVPQPDNFYIKFVVGTKQVVSSPFKIVSSTTMLPKDVRDTVRPKKGGKDDSSAVKKS